MQIQKYALLSVSDKSGLIELATHLHSRSVQMIASGGTAALLTSNNIPCIDVCTFTGDAEMLGGRVKTLHPKIVFHFPKPDNLY